MKIAIVGPTGGTHIADSFARAAWARGLEVLCLDTRDAFTGPAVLRSLSWRILDRRPPRIDGFSRDMLNALTRESPRVLLVVGLCPFSRATIEAARAPNLARAIFLTDDPFNPNQGSRRLRDALAAYDLIFTPRRSNMEALRRLTGRESIYLPFAYDETLFRPEPSEPVSPAPDILFVGGADEDRASFIRGLLAAGARGLGVAGGNWDRFPDLRHLWLGMKSPSKLRDLTAAAKVNLCLVRRANRDGHVMRSFEIPAAGGCLLAEDTEEHREIFGAEGDVALYFSSPAEAAQKALTLIDAPSRRLQLKHNSAQRILSGDHTYGRRLEAILTAAAPFVTSDGA